MNRHKLVFFITLFVTGIVSQSFSQPSRFSRENYISKEGDTLRYRQLQPDANKMRKYPLVIFLHGAGERGNDNDAQLKWGVMNFATDENMMKFPAYVIAPQCPQGKLWSNFTDFNKGPEMRLQNSPSQPMKLLIELIRQKMKSLPIDSTRIYITGLSMGGFGTFDAITRYPNLFAAAVPVCGGGDASKAETIAHIPIWIFNGAEDPTVNPMYSIQMFNEITKAGGHPAFTQYPEVGHFSWLGAYIDPLMMQWMFRQHK